MKNTFQLFLRGTLYLMWIFLIISCGKIDHLSDSVNDIEHRLEKVEQLCSQLNSNLKSLTEIVNSINSRDYITSFEPIYERDSEIGAQIFFASNKSITIYYGEDNKSSKLGVIKDDAGVFYWTLNGELIISPEGDKYIVGQVVPQIKFENSIWSISFDKGKSWIILGNIVEDLLVSYIEEHDKYLTLILCDGQRIELPYIGDAELLEFSFSMKNNAYILQDDIICTFKNNNYIECRIPYIVSSKKLIPTFEFIGKSISIDGVYVESGKTEIDFSKPVSIVIEGNKGSDVEYILSVYSFTGLPIVRINTENYEAVVSKDDYLNATFELSEDIITKGAGEVVKYDVKIKGRGNSTWSLPKKPYKIKFSEKVSILGESAEKSWLLLANYTDKTFLRNSTAFYMGLMSNLSYTIKSHFVELILNERYVGTYLLCEDKDVSENRINLSDNGYLLEIDAKAAPEDITFGIQSIGNPINIKEPEIEIGSDEYELVKEYLLQVEQALYSDNFTSAESGYTNYIDVDSFIDWYLINEIAKNNDAIFYSSCYMTWEPGGKLHMGPLWDFDIAFGNVNYNDCQFPEGFWIKRVPWFSRLFEDPSFVIKVKERFDYFYSKSSEILSYINSSSTYLKYSMLENNAVWGTLYSPTWPNFAVSGSYENEIQYMKTFIVQRLEWLKTEFDKM